MPLYEYRCEECGHRFEVLQRLGETSDGLVCPQCGRERPERQLSTFAAGGGLGSERTVPAGGCCRGTPT